MNQLTTDEPKKLPQAVGETAAIMAVIERVAMSPDADLQKLEKMLDMQERVMDRNAKQCFTADLAAMQAELPLVSKDGRGHNNAKYARLEDINEAIRPTLQKYGFAVTFRVKQADKSVTVSAILSHRLGHSEDTDLCLPLDISGNKNAVQAVGSTISYGKRYALCALLNISTGDDTDGNYPAANLPATASSADIKRIRDALRVSGYDETAFCQSAGIASLDQLLANRVLGAIKHIQGKASQ